MQLHEKHQQHGQHAHAQLLVHLALLQRDALHPKLSPVLIMWNQGKPVGTLMTSSIHEDGQQGIGQQALGLRCHHIGGCEYRE